MDTIRIFGEHVLTARVPKVVLDKGVPAGEVWEPKLFVIHRKQGAGLLHFEVFFSPAENTDLEFPMAEFTFDQEYLRQPAHTIYGPGDRVILRATPTADVTLQIVILGIKHEWRAASVPSTSATGATAGKPGTWTPSGTAVPQDVHALKANDPVKVTATPLTKWLVGEYVVCKGGANAYWDGTTWATGKAP